ncbi:TPA: alpha/beta hydrolase family protein [Stenotrophomonas maltophilia]
MPVHRRALMLSLALLTGPALAAEPQQVANQLLDHLQAGQIADAEAMLTAQMAQAVPADRLGVLWTSLGALQQRGAAEVSTQQGMHLVVVPLQFASGRVVAQVAVDAQDKVAGLMLRPAPAAKAAPPPADADYGERDFSVPQARGALPGTLALPKGKGPFPAVVLVHGSGPQDRDETIGGNRPFLDIARGLASQGIAVLRYDKRTFARPQDFQGGRFTVDDETTDDAVAALTALAADPRIDGRRVFVLGHSQGGMLAPRIPGTGRRCGARSCGRRLHARCWTCYRNRTATCWAWTAASMHPSRPFWIRSTGRSPPRGAARRWPPASCRWGCRSRSGRVSKPLMRAPMHRHCARLC